MEWISVKDFLPEKGDTVWVYCPNEVFDTQKQRAVNVFLNDSLWTKGIVTHWMPLPKPPKQ